MVLPSEQWNNRSTINNISVDKPTDWDFIVSCLKRRTEVETYLESAAKRQKRDDLSDLIKEIVPLFGIQPVTQHAFHPFLSLLFLCPPL